MSAKDKDNKPLRRLKQFFGIKGIGNLLYSFLAVLALLNVKRLIWKIICYIAATLKSRQDFILAPDVEAQLHKDNSMNQRIRILRDLCEAVKENSVEYVCL